MTKNLTIYAQKWRFFTSFRMTGFPFWTAPIFFELSHQIIRIKFSILCLILITLTYFIYSWIKTLPKVSDTYTEKELIVETKSSDLITIQKKNILSRIPQTLSTMPGNYQALLTEKQLYDLLTYLLTLK